jgi:hypothetical protein
MNAPTRAMIFSVGYLFIQLAVPIWGLSVPGQTRFSWKMFVRDDDAATFVVEYEDGSRKTVEELNNAAPTAVILSPLDGPTFVPPHLCRLEGARFVIISRRAGESVHQCE